VIDVAIVGGGVAGAYTAYRLTRPEAKRSPVIAGFLERSGRSDPTVVLLEREKRIGGRLWSYRFPGMPDQPVELGGMGFSQLQQNVYGLCTRELNLKTSPCDFFNTQLLQYLRTRRFNTTDYDKPDLIPYALTASESGRDPGTIMTAALTNAVPGSGELIGRAIEAIRANDLPGGLTAINSLTALLREATVAEGCSACAGTPIYQVGFWNLLSDMISIEAYHLCNDSAFAPSFNLNWNLYDSFQSLISIVFCFMLETPFMKLDNGYDELPRRMVEEFEQTMARTNRDIPPTRMQTQLYALLRKEIDGESLIELSVGPPDAEASERLVARSVVLALPKHALQQLDRRSVVYEGEHFEEDMAAITPIAITKVFAAYDRPWWSEAGIRSGYSTTDLPVKAVYYVDSRSDGNSLLLASYCDDRFTQFWDGYLIPSRFQEFDRWYGAGNGIQSIDDRLWAPEELVREVQREMKQMHGNDQIPDPVNAVHFNWGDPPFGGGFHNWNPHYKSWEVMPRIRKPVGNASIYICGEAFSSGQGWVEGAVNTAEMTVEQHFGLERPDWVLPNYDFGP
jgi:monoamine oxidase